MNGPLISSCHFDSNVCGDPEKRENRKKRTNGEKRWIIPPHAPILLSSNSSSVFCIDYFDSWVLSNICSAPTSTSIYTHFTIPTWKLYYTLPKDLRPSPLSFWGSYRYYIQIYLPLPPTYATCRKRGNLNIKWGGGWVQWRRVRDLWVNWSQILLGRTFSLFIPYTQ